MFRVRGSRFGLGTKAGVSLGFWGLGFGVWGLGLGIQGLNPKP